MAFLKSDGSEAGTVECRLVEQNEEVLGNAVLNVTAHIWHPASSVPAIDSIRLAESEATGPVVFLNSATNVTIAPQWPRGGSFEVGTQVRVPARHCLRLALARPLL